MRRKLTDTEHRRVRRRTQTQAILAEKHNGHLPTVEPYKPSRCKACKTRPGDICTMTIVQGVCQHFCMECYIQSLTEQGKVITKEV